MKRAIVLGLVVALLGGLVVGCDRGSPADVAIAFYREANAGNYKKAESYLSSHLIMSINMMQSLPGFGTIRLDNAMDAATKDGTIQRIEVERGLEHSASFAQVYLTIYYKEGQASDILTFQKENRQWRIVQSALLLLGFGSGP